MSEILNLQDLSVTEPEGAEVSEWSTLCGVCHTLNSGE